MKRTLIIAALFLGFSVAGFSQTMERAVLVDETTGEQVEIIIDNNNNVTVNIGEYVQITTNGTTNMVVLKTSGEYVGVASIFQKCIPDCEAPRSSILNVRSKPSTKGSKLGG